MKRKVTSKKLVPMMVIASLIFNPVVRLNAVFAGDELDPNITIIQPPNVPTNEDILITIKVNDEGSGVRELTLPDGTKVTEKITTYTVVENGTYLFKAVDQVGNEVKKTVTIHTIDKIKPTLTLESSTTEPTNQEVIITAVAEDLESGIREIVLPDGEVVSDTTASFTVVENGIYTFWTRDYAGNETEKSIEIANIDKSLPSKGIIKVIAKNEEGGIIQTFVNNDLNLTLQVVTAPNIPGYLLTGSRTVTVWLKPTDSVKEVAFTYKIDPDWPGWKENQNVAEENEKGEIESGKRPNQPGESQKPKTENIPLDTFVARWEGHQVLTEEPTYIEEKSRPTFKVDEDQLEVMAATIYSPRLYGWNETKEKWVALATKIDGNKVEPYQEVEGYVAMFAVKQPTFSDVRADKWYVETTDRANGFAIVEGFKEENGATTLRPERTISKAEFYTMATRIFGAVPEGQTSLYKTLPSVNTIGRNAWYEPYVETLYNKGFLEEDNHLNEDIKRIEAMEVLTKLITEVEDVALVNPNSFKDMGQYRNVEIANIIKGYEDGTLRPNKNLTRAEALTLIINALESLGW